MPVIRTALLMNGMILLADAVAPNGQVVLPAGTVIDTENLSLLTSRRVRRVEVSAAPGQSLDLAEPVHVGGVEKDTVSARALMEITKANTSIMEARLIRVAHMFSPHKDDPLMRDLCRIAIKCAQERLISV